MLSFRYAKGFLLFIYVLLCVSVIVACDKTRESTKKSVSLVGEYRLVVGDPQFLKDKRGYKDQINVRGDGTFSHVCERDGVVIHELSREKWSFDGKNIHFSTYRDCLGVWPKAKDDRPEGASLIVELTDPVVILLSPDLNIYYEKVLKK